MLYHLAIHRPKPEHEQDLIDSMHRFGAAARAQGAIEAHTFKDERSDALVGLAIWRSDEDLAAARPALGTATEQDDFDAWESGPVELFLLHDVFDYDFDVRKGFSKLSVKRQKAARTSQRLRRVFRQTVIDAVFGHHLCDRSRTALVPDLFEPATHQGFVSFQVVLFVHEDLQFELCLCTRVSSATAIDCKRALADARASDTTTQVSNLRYFTSFSSM